MSVLLLLLLLTTARLARELAWRIHSGTGGVILRSVSAPAAVAAVAASAASSSSRISSVTLSARRWNESHDAARLSGLGAAGRLPLRILRMLLMLRMLCLSEMTWPPLGAATTTVPGVAIGGGVGESDRKSGWMWDSLCVACCVNEVRGACDWTVRVEAGL